MTTKFKVTIGVKEITVRADTEGEATADAMKRLNDNIAWVQVSKVEERQTGFRAEPKPAE